MRTTGECRNYAHDSPRDSSLCRLRVGCPRDVSFENKTINPRPLPMLRSSFRSMPQSDMVNSDASAATRALAQFPLTSSPMSVLAATRQGGTGKSTCAKICTWLMLFHFFSVACATSQHSSTLFDHSMSKWFDAVSSNFKMEANATDFDSIHHVAAAFYDMHHRTAHLSAVDDEFSDTFFHIATQPSHVPIFSASESIFNAHELSFVMHMVSADARHSGLRVNIDAQKLNVLTPPYVYGQINMQGPNPENLGAHGDHLPHAAMQGGAVTRDDHRGRRTASRIVICTSCVCAGGSCMVLGGAGRPGAHAM